MINRSIDSVIKFSLIFSEQGQGNEFFTKLPGIFLQFIQIISLYFYKPMFVVNDHFIFNSLIWEKKQQTKNKDTLEFYVGFQIIFLKLYLSVNPNVWNLVL